MLWIILTWVMQPDEALCTVLNCTGWWKYSYIHNYSWSRSTLYVHHCSLLCTSPTNTQLHITDDTSRDWFIYYLIHNHLRQHGDFVVSTVTSEKKVRVCILCLGVHSLQIVFITIKHDFCSPSLKDCNCSSTVFCPVLSTIKLSLHFAEFAAL